MSNVPTLHVPMKKELISTSLKDNDFMVNTKIKQDVYIYT